MALWMAYALVLGVLFGSAAAGLESALRAWRLPARWAVAGGVVASALAPLLPLARPSVAATGTSATVGRSLQEAVEELVRPGFLATLDRPLAALWIVSALGVLVVAAATYLRMRRLAQRATEGSFEGIPYRCTPDFGPAVVGFVRGVIVLPSWVTALDPGSLRLALRHEREHLRARDPALQLAGALMAALQPWNLALWWQARRLRHAIELDCDGRLLRSGVDLRVYADLLCNVVARRGPGARLALALGAPRSRLAQRVDRLTESLGRRRTGRAAVGTAAATLLVAGGLQLPFPHAAPTTALVRSPRAILKLDFPGEAGRPDSVVTFELHGTDAARAVQGMIGTPQPSGEGKLIRKVIRRGLPPGAPSSSPDPGAAGR